MQRFEITGGVTAATLPLNKSATLSGKLGESGFHVAAPLAGLISPK